MKILSALILLLLSFFSGTKHTSHISSQAVYISPMENAAGSGGNGNCHAINTNSSDPQAYLPDPTCTPGVINQQVTQANIDSTICVAGYTTSIRPPASYTDSLKRQQIQLYGYTDTNPKDYEEDHFISLEIGGNPTDPKNLWPEPHPSINEKDKVENYLHKKICSGQLTLAQAQTEISTNWYTIYQKIQ